MDVVVEIKRTFIVPPFGMEKARFEIPREHDLLIHEVEVKNSYGLPSSWFDAGRDVYLTRNKPLYPWAVEKGAWGYFAYRGTSLVLEVWDDLGQGLKPTVILRGTPVGRKVSDGS